MPESAPRHPAASAPDPPHPAKASYTRADIGLRANRPFRFCTMQWDQAVHEEVPPGDDPDATASRAIQLSMTMRHRQAHAVPAHTHEFYEIALIRGGSSRHVVNDRETRLTRGDIVVIVPGASHAYLNIEGMFKTNIYLEPSWFFDDLHLLWWEDGLVRHLLAGALFNLPARLGVHMLRIGEPEMTFCEQEIGDMAREALKAHPSLIAFHGGFLKILNVLNEAFKQDRLYQSLPLKAQVWDTAEAIEQMIRHSQPLDIERIARQLHMSKTSLDRIFLEGTGMSPTAYFQQRRIQHSLRLLMNPQASIADIACTLGFSDQAHFSRLFKRVMGTSPNAYRQDHQAPAGTVLINPA